MCRDLDGDEGYPQRWSAPTCVIELNGGNYQVFVQKKQRARHIGDETAKTLDFAIPQSVILLADEVIE